MCWANILEPGETGTPPDPSRRVEVCEECIDWWSRLHIEWVEGVTKTHQGGLVKKQRRVPRQAYATGGIRCPVRLLKKLVSKQPENMKTTWTIVLDSPLQFPGWQRGLVCHYTCGSQHHQQLYEEYGKCSRTWCYWGEADEPQCLESNSEKSPEAGYSEQWHCCHHKSSQCTEFAAVCGDGAGKPCPDKQSIEQWLSVCCGQASSTWLQPKYPSNTIICSTYSSTSVQLQQLYCILWEHTSKQYIYTVSTCCDFKAAASCLALFQALRIHHLQYKICLGSFIMWCVPQDVFLRQQIMVAGLLSTCTRKLKVETSQPHMIYYSCKL